MGYLLSDISEHIKNHLLSESYGAPFKLCPVKNVEEIMRAYSSHSNLSRAAAQTASLLAAAAAAAAVPILSLPQIYIYIWRSTLLTQHRSLSWVVHSYQTVLTQQTTKHLATLLHVTIWIFLCNKFQVLCTVNGSGLQHSYSLKYTNKHMS